MRNKIYKNFKAKAPIRPTGLWSVVTEDKEELVIALIPSHIKNPEAVAKSLSQGLTESDLALTDLI